MGLVIIPKQKPEKKDPKKNKRRSKQKPVKKKKPSYRSDFSKETRQRIIETILKENEISSIEELISYLNDFGINDSKEVVSQDLRQMRVIKNFTETGKQAYRLPETPVINVKQYLNSSNLSNLVLEVKAAGTLVVVNTTSGGGKAIATAIENTDDEKIVGVIGGFNTTFVACETEEDARIIAKKIQAFTFSGGN